jgi:AcrR family transcriptional regulator
MHSPMAMFQAYVRIPVIESEPPPRETVPARPTAPRKRRAPKAKKKRVANYGSRNTPASDAKQRAIMEVVDAGFGSATIREICDLTGMSRQLVHYHMRKLVYRGDLVAVLERASRPGVLRYRLYTPEALMTRGLHLVHEAA